MRKIKVSVGTNRVGSTVTREFEIEDNEELLLSLKQEVLELTKNC